MKHYYFSGIDRASFLDVLAREGAAGMVNAANVMQPAMIAAYERFPQVPLALDSGAYQGNEDIVGYAKIVKQIGKRFEWVSNLDVIGDQEKSNRNWEVLADNGAKTLWVYQVEGGKDLDYFFFQARRHGFVGVGGLVPVIKRDVKAARILIHSIGRMLKMANAKAHFFGVGSPGLLVEFGKEAWFESADSQSWLCGYKAGELIRSDGSRLSGNKIGLSLSGAECAAQNIRQIHGWMTGKPLQLSIFES